jgi:hypothetical protein
VRQHLTASDPPDDVTEGRALVSIVPQDPDRKLDPPPIVSLRTVADMMSKSPDAYTVNVGFLVDYIAGQHEPPITCAECNEDRRDGMPCLMHESALSVAFAWLLKVADERG